MNPKFLYFSLSLSLSLLVILVLQFSSLANPQNTSPPIPDRVKPCIPTADLRPIKRVQLITSTKLDNKEYFLISAYNHLNEQFGVGSDLIISVHDITNTCKEEFYNPMGDRMPLASFIPQPVANQLTLKRYKKAMQKLGGKSQLQQDVNQNAQTNNPVWFQEEVWALKQLGIQIPSNVKIR